MIFRTEMKIPPMECSIVYGDGILFLGSCFADEVGNLCKGLGFNAMVNPFGVLYNPLSIERSLYRLHSGQPFTEEEVIEVGEEFYCTFCHNTDFWNPSKEGLLQQVNTHLAEAHRHFLQTKWVILSLGTAWVYRLHDTHEVVSNCHKLPAQRFDRAFLGTEQIVQALSELLRDFPDKQFIFTVSPLRHLKDGLHENLLSKSALLLAVDQLCRSFSNGHYFPAYEIMMDELRDYRFYKEDMVHPTDQAVHYIWERFVDFAIADSERPSMQQASELRKMYRHQALFPESQAYQRFLATRKEKEEQLKNRYPAVISAYLPH